MTLMPMLLVRIQMRRYTPSSILKMISQALLVGLGCQPPVIPLEGTELTSMPTLYVIQPLVRFWLMRLDTTSQ